MRQSLKWAVGVLGGVVLGVTSASAVDYDEIIQSSWASVQRSRGGLGGELCCNAGGACTQSSGLVMDLSYEQQGRRAVLSIAAEGGAKAQRPERFVTVELQDGDHTLRLSPAADTPAGAAPEWADKLAKLARVPSPRATQRGLIGEWDGTMPSMDPARPDAEHKVRLQLGADGRARLSIAFVEMPLGQLQQQANGQVTLTTTRSAQVLTATVAGDELQLLDPKGSVRRYNRLRF